MTPATSWARLISSISILKASSSAHLRRQPRVMSRTGWVDSTSRKPRVFPAVTSFAARKFTLDIAVPFFVIQGRDDHVVSGAAAKAYVTAVRAPHKAFVAIDGGHFACFMNPTEFVSTLRKLVLGKPSFA